MTTHPGAKIQLSLEPPNTSWARSSCLQPCQPGLTSSLYYGQLASWMDPLAVLCILPQSPSLSCVLLPLMGPCGCILERRDCLSCWELMMNVAISLQLRPLCSDSVGLHPIVRALPALGSPRLPAGVTSGSSLLLPFLIHPGSEFLDVYL